METQAPPATNEPIQLSKYRKPRQIAAQVRNNDFRVPTITIGVGSGQEARYALNNVSREHALYLLMGCYLAAGEMLELLTQARCKPEKP